MHKFEELLHYYQKIYQDQCSSFVQDNHELWPIGTEIGAEKAHKVFNLGWDLELIISNWRSENSLLPDQYQYDLYSQLIIFGMILCVLVVLILICCCQVFCTTKHKVFMRCCYIDVETDTKSNIEKYFLFFTIIILSILLCGIGGLSYTDKQIENSILQVKCISLWMIETTIQQEIDSGWKSNWQGIIYIDNLIHNLTEDFKQDSVEEAINQLKNAQNNNLQSIYTEENKMIQNLYDNYTEVTLNNPNPYKDQNIESPLLNQMGPINQLGTVTNLLASELKNRKNAIDYIKSIKQKSEQINQTIIINNLDKSLVSLNRFSKEVINFLSELESQINNKSWIVDKGVIAYKRFIIFTCSISMILIISFSIVTWFRFQKMGFLLHLSWIVIVVLLLFGFIILTFVYYASLINDNMVCSIASGVLNDKNILKQIIKIMHPEKQLFRNESFFKQFEICLYENGDFVSYYSLNNTFSNIIAIDKSIKQLGQLTYNQEVLDSYQNTIQNYLSNYSTVINEINDDNPQIVLQILNSWTNYNYEQSLQLSKGCCKVSQDEWEWKNQDCKSYKANNLSDNFNNTPNREFGMSICLIFDQYDEQFAKERYQNQYKECKTNISNTILLYFNSLRKYTISVNEIFGGIQQILLDYQRNLINLDTQIQQQTINLTYYGSQLIQVFEKTEELKKTLDCSYIKSGSIKFKKTFCTTFRNGLFFMYIYLTSICCLLSCLGIVSVWSAIRCIPKSEQHQVFLETAAIMPTQIRNRKNLDIN